MASVRAFLVLLLLVTACCSLPSFASASLAVTTPLITAERRDSIDVALKKLYQEVQQHQWQSDKNASVLPLELGHVKGQYKNDIHINFVGDPLLSKLRRELGATDNNMFVTQFVLESLVKGHTYAPDVVPINDTSVRMGVASSLANKDKNFQSDAPIFGFWPQRLVKHHYNNITSWTQFSINLEGLSGQGESIIEWTHRMLSKLKLEWLWDKLFKPLQNQILSIFHTFNIPPDTDDTATMLAFAHDTLYANRDALPESWRLWEAKNFNIGKAFGKLLEHAYCPAEAPRRKPDHKFQDGKVFENQNALIDSRSYFWAEDFILSLTAPDECIATTWVQSFGEQLQYWEKKAAPPLQPFNMNNIDPTVDSNFLYAFVSALLFTKNTSFFDNNTRMQKFLVTTAKFVAFALDRQPTQTRADLEMLYYPPTVNIVFFASRVLALLDSNAAIIRHGALHDVAGILRKCLRTKSGGGTKYLMQHALRDDQCFAQGGKRSRSVACWNGFLGANDTEHNGTTHTPHHDDRFFTTAVAVNGLIDSWTTTTKSGNTARLAYLESTPMEVIQLAEAGVEYLLEAYKLPETLYANAFFSGSVKSLSDIPFYLPANVIFDMNNKSYDYCSNNATGNDAENPTLWAMLGTVSKEEYAKMVAQGCGGYPTMQKFDGWNVDWWPWPYWSSEALSKAFALLGISKLRNILEG